MPQPYEEGQFGKNWHVTGERSNQTYVGLVPIYDNLNYEDIIASYMPEFDTNIFFGDTVVADGQYEYRSPQSFLAKPKGILDNGDPQVTITHDGHVDFNLKWPPSDNNIKEDLTKDPRYHRLINELDKPEHAPERAYFDLLMNSNNFNTSLPHQESHEVIRWKKPTKHKILDIFNTGISGIYIPVDTYEPCQLVLPIENRDKPITADMRIQSTRNHLDLFSNIGQLDGSDNFWNSVLSQIQYPIKVSDRHGFTYKNEAYRKLHSDKVE